MTLDEDEPARPPGRSGAPRPLTDPRTMRAVSHPTRLALLDALAVRQPLTATEAAEMIGDTATNCSFHLRMLAKYGFVEEAGPAPGRRRPWRLTHIGFTVDSAATQLGEDVHAAEALGRLMWSTWIERLERVNAGRSALKGAWDELTSASGNVAYLTPEEARQWSQDTQALLDRFRNRLEDPALRPADSEAVEVLLFTYPREAAVRRPREGD
jgi:predicted ArsR family transcriptional regulator